MFAVFDLISNHGSILFLRMPCPGFVFPFCSRQIQNINSFVGSFAFLLEESMVTPSKSCHLLWKEKPILKVSVMKDFTLISF